MAAFIRVTLKGSDHSSVTFDGYRDRVNSSQCMCACLAFDEDHQGVDLDLSKIVTYENQITQEVLRQLQGFFQTPSVVPLSKIRFKHPINYGYFPMFLAIADWLECVDLLRCTVINFFRTRYRWKKFTRSKEATMAEQRSMIEFHLQKLLIIQPYLDFFSLPNAMEYKSFYGGHADNGLDEEGKIWSESFIIDASGYHSEDIIEKPYINIAMHLFWGLMALEDFNENALKMCENFIETCWKMSSWQDPNLSSAYRLITWNECVVPVVSVDRLPQMGIDYYEYTEIGYFTPLLLFHRDKLLGLCEHNFDAHFLTLKQPDGTVTFFGGTFENAIEKIKKAYSESLTFAIPHRFGHFINCDEKFIRQLDSLVK